LKVALQRRTEFGLTEKWREKVKTEFALLLIIPLMLQIGCEKQSRHGEPPLNPANMDLTVEPGVDFFRYANGNWMAQNPVPDDFSRYSAFEQLAERNNDDIKALLDEAASKADKRGGNWQKIGLFYTMGMDTVQIEEQGLAPLAAEFSRIDSLKTVNQVREQIAWMHDCGISSLFHFWAGQDEKNSNQVIAQLTQGGLGMPDRDYYLENDDRSQELRREYLAHLQAMFELLGDTPEQAAAYAQTVLQIETRLAKASMSRLEMRDPQKTYNKMRIEELVSASPSFAWPDYLAKRGFGELDSLNVGQPLFFKEISAMIESIPVADWQTYCRWNLVNSTAAYLNKAFVDQDFHFYGTVLSGRKAQRPRWKRVLGAVNGAMGEALGQLYVEKYFPAAAKSRMLELVANLKIALGQRIALLDWMSEETKQKAQEKLEHMNVKIGYPDKWIDYSTLELGDDSFVQNVLRARRFNLRRELAEIDKPVDREKWEMVPQTVNAYYHPVLNEVVFPAAILQFPFFNMEADDAVNYGAIGVVIGHEMTHGFDDQGRQYDMNGNLNDWWTEEDAKRFKERTQVLVDQFNRFAVFDTLHINGELTLGENIADLGGLNIAYTAYQNSRKGKPEAQAIDGFSPEQRFFLAYAQVWRQNIRDKELMRRVKEDVHSPGNFRVNGPLTNMPEFFAAFAVEPGKPLYRETGERAKIW